MNVRARKHTEQLCFGVASAHYFLKRFRVLSRFLERRQLGDQTQ